MLSAWERRAVGDTNKNVEIAMSIAEGMKAGDMDANRTYHRLFKQCIGESIAPLEQRELEYAKAMVSLIVTLLLPVPARMDFMAAAEEIDDDV